MKDYVQLWFDHLRRCHQDTIPSRIEITGEYDKHTGPMWPRAAVRMVVEPADAFEVVDEVENPGSLVEFQHPDYIIFGLLDILMPSPAPTAKIKVIIKGVEVDPVETTRMAFLMAGRDAGRKILEATKQR